jgi:hypothetical protein
LRLVNFCRDVKVVLIPEHLRPRSKPGSGFKSALNVDKVAGPRCGGPSGIVEEAIDSDRFRRSIADISVWYRQVGVGEVDGNGGKHAKRRLSRCFGVLRSYCMLGNQPLPVVALET